MHLKKQTGLVGLFLKVLIHFQKIIQQFAYAQPEEYQKLRNWKSYLAFVAPILDGCRQQNLQMDF